MASITPPMISAAKTTKCLRGFTLLEIVMALAIASLVTGGMMAMLVYSSDGHQLKAASVEIESLAKRARMTAIVKQTPYALEFRDGMVRMLPWAQAGFGEKTSPSGHRIGGGLVFAAEDGHQYEFKRGMGLAIRHWNSNAWQPAFRNTVLVWRFDPTGLCEPVSIRIALGNSWMQDTYHPLTASIHESISEAR